MPIGFRRPCYGWRHSRPGAAKVNWAWRHSAAHQVPISPNQVRRWTISSAQEAVADYSPAFRAGHTEKARPSGRKWRAALRHGYWRSGHAAAPLGCRTSSQIKPGRHCAGSPYSEGGTTLIWCRGRSRHVRRIGETGGGRNTSVITPGAGGSSPTA